MTQIVRTTETASKLIAINQADWVVKVIQSYINYYSIREPSYWLMHQRESDDKPIQFFDPPSKSYLSKDKTLWGREIIQHLFLMMPIDMSRISLEHSVISRDNPRFVLTPWSLVVKDNVMMTVGEHFDGEREEGYVDPPHRVVETSSRRKKDVLAPRTKG